MTRPGVSITAMPLPETMVGSVVLAPALKAARYSRLPRIETDKRDLPAPAMPTTTANGGRAGNDGGLTFFFGSFAKWTPCGKSRRHVKIKRV